METFNYVPAPGQSKNVTPRVLKAQFGDGYSQRVGDGINFKPRTYQLVFNREMSVILEIDAFLNARAGIEAFIWTPLNGTAGVWLCESWVKTDTLLNVGSISATFIEVFES